MNLSLLKRLLVFTEGGADIGLGHLSECHAIMENLKMDRKLEEALFIVNDDIGARRFLDSRQIPYEFFVEGTIPSAEIINRFDLVLVDKKKVKFEFLKALKSCSKRLAVLDDLGGKRITADILVNFSINQKRYNYDFPEERPITYFGPEFFPAGPAVFEALKIQKRGNSKTILVSLGGYNHSRTIEKVLTALKEFDGYMIEIVLGPGFLPDPSFEAFVDSLGGSFQFFENVSDLPQRIRQASFLINSGGNTLYEAAIVGTPVLVIGEENHEIEQGKIFEQKGIAINLEKGKRATVDDIKSGVQKMLSLSWDIHNSINLTPFSRILN